MRGVQQHETAEFIAHINLFGILKQLEIHVDQGVHFGQRFLIQIAFFNQAGRSDARAHGVDHVRGDGHLVFDRATDRVFTRNRALLLRNHPQTVPAIVHDRTVTHGKNIRQIRAHLIVHHNAAVDVDAAVFQHFQTGADTG